MGSDVKQAGRFKQWVGGLAALALSANVAAQSADPHRWQLNMGKGVTASSQHAYDAHMFALWVCVAIGAIVFAAMLLSLSDLLRRVLPVSHGIALGIVLVVLSSGLGLLLWLFGSQVAREVATLVEALPPAYEQFQDWVEETTVGSLLAEQIDTLRNNVGRIATSAGAMAMTFSGGLMNLLLVLIGAIYIAAQPGMYRAGLLQLIPKPVRDVSADALDSSARALRLWLGGQLVAMAVVAVLTGIGLWLLGVPAAFALALIAFLLDFVPIIGPIAAAIPGILLGFTVSPQVGLATTALYIVIQQIESNLLQPLIQQRAPNLAVGFGLDTPYRLLLVEVRVEQVRAEVTHLLVVLPRRKDAD